MTAVSRAGARGGASWIRGAGLGTGHENPRRLARLSRAVYFLASFLEVFLKITDTVSSNAIKCCECP